MQKQFDTLKQSRKLILKLIENLSIEQLNKIPEGFKNNIAWNIAHLVVTQQLLHYKLSGLDCLCPDDLIRMYKKGTAPTKTFTEEEFDEVKELFVGLPNTLEEDFQAGIFQNFSEYPTSAGYVLNSFESAVVFNNFHEGIHYGVIRSIKKFL